MKNAFTGTKAAIGEHLTEIANYYTTEIEKRSMDYENAIVKIGEKVLDDFSAEEKAALQRAILDSDAAVLYEMGLSSADIQSLIANPDTKIAEIREYLKATTTIKNNAERADYAAAALADFMRNGTSASEYGFTNAYTITSKLFAGHNDFEAIVNAIDMLSTLYYFKHMTKEEPCISHMNKGESCVSHRTKEDPSVLHMTKGEPCGYT